MDELPALVSAARRGERAAFAELYRRFHRAVHGVVLARVAHGDAADLVQETFAAALERLPQLVIAAIGTAELFEGTRVRLDRTEPARHQLHLERGRMHARVVAPPRIFAITTPSTSVVDLGCEYTIEIDGEGRGSITVQAGKVELEGTGGVVVAPAGTITRLLAGRQPSLPLADGASAELRAAVDELERGARAHSIGSSRRRPKVMRSR